MLAAILLLSYVAAFGQASENTIEAVCPTEVVQTVDAKFLGVKGDSCFQFVIDEKRSYEAAVEECGANNGTLAMPKTEKLNNYLQDQLLNAHGVTDEVWIGLSDLDEENIFEWADGTIPTYTNLPGEKEGLAQFFKSINGQYADCVVMNPKDGSWKDTNCFTNVIRFLSQNHNIKQFVCQYQNVVNVANDVTTADDVNASNDVDAVVNAVDPAPQGAGEDEFGGDDFIDEDFGSDGATANLNSVKDECADFTCDKNCGLLGFQKKDNCPICECNHPFPKKSEQ